ncbi:MAG: alpha/beta hydrolase [Anaerolineae bacterium]|jgi:pimeloyl-ACP methyl ester carboxylesterase|nr:alpha/beta hydrolase [Anaerolineae bacterium]
MTLRILGEGAVTVIIDTALGMPSADWWPLQTELAQETRVITYDRAGYGDRPRASTPRTSAQIAQDLYQQLVEAGISGPYPLVGHSQGGLNLQYFARLFASQVAGVVLIDPRSPENHRFQSELSETIYAQSGVDKAGMLKMNGRLARWGLLRLLRPWVMQMIPFFYYRDMTPIVTQTMWAHFQRPALYQTALEEDRLAQGDQPERIGAFPPVPLRVICHTPQVIVDEIVKYAGLSEEDAWQVERLWRNLIADHLCLSGDSALIEADHSGHFIHLSQPELVINVIRDLLKSGGD